MPQSPLPNDWEELLAEHALHQLIPGGTEIDPSLLDEHPELIQELERLKETLELIPYALLLTEPPPHLKTAILKAAGNHTGQRLNLTAQRRFNWRRAAGAIAAISIAALAVDNYHIRQQSQEARLVSRLLEQPETVLYTLKGTGQTPNATASLLINTKQQDAVVLAHNLPKLPQNQVYRLWAITPTAGVVYFGEFQTTLQNRAFVKLNLPPNLQQPAPEVRVTQEQASAPPIPAGPLVMTGVL